MTNDDTARSHDNNIGTDENAEWLKGDGLL